MAESKAVWGIEIGQAGLKAIKLRYAEAAKQVLAVAFDYVPHPKILSQPDAVPDELIRQALDTFLSRNQIGGDLVVMSVPGQTALVKFIQLPPVEQAKVAEIVKYEARQQIPFPLEEVIWDFQPIGSGMEESGFLIDAEVGLFAMKREQVMHHMQPFAESKIELEAIQIAPLAVYNFLCYDRFGIRPDEEGGPADEFTIVLDMGADNTNLLVTNGNKILVRNLPIGGNHFTRALTKEMKLTFAKAEHLKCNATRSPDPRAVFQALRPVFNDYVNEIQRAIGYFASVNRQAKIGKILGIGNGFKLAGLQKFLQQNLQYEVERVETFESSVGENVLSAPLFQENVLTFVVPYGLALQGLKVTQLNTSLLPPEIVVARKIRKKKPWAVSTAATLLVGLASSAAGYSAATQTVSNERWDETTNKVKSVAADATAWDNSYKSAVGTNGSLISQGDTLTAGLEAREYWPEVYKAINAALPRDTNEQLDETELTKKHRISLRGVTAKRYSDLAKWYDGLTDRQKSYLTEQEKEAGPSGEGYVFTLEGVHYHYEENDPRDGQGIGYVMATLIRNLRQHVIERPDSVPVPVGKIGISHATIVQSSQVRKIDFYPNGKPGGDRRNLPGPASGGFAGAGGVISGDGGAPMPAGPGRGRGLPSAGDLGLESEDVVVLKIPQTMFTMEFAWKPTPPSERVDITEEETAEGAGSNGTDSQDIAAP